jgi:N-acetylglutamate synthase-like GNAT family acetyltransferase
MSSPSPDLAFRPARAADVDLIRDWIKRYSLNPMGIDWRRFTLATLGPDGPVVGMGQIKVHRDGSRELASIGVAEAERGRGIARELIQHMLAAEVGDLYLTCRQPMRDFYRPFGFADVDDGQDLPTYFRRIARATGWLHHLAPGWGPAIMRRRVS